MGRRVSAELLDGEAFAAGSAGLLRIGGPEVNVRTHAQPIDDGEGAGQLERISGGQRMAGYQLLSVIEDRFGQRDDLVLPAPVS